MTIAVMQPYFFPYIGYFQLMNAVDEFVIYDNIEFTKKGWINRNRIGVHGKDEFITVPLKKDSDYLNVVDRRLAASWPAERVKLLNKVKESYRKSAQFQSCYPVVEEAIMFEENNLFSFVLNSLKMVATFLGIKTSLIISSQVPIDHSLKGEAKVLSICHSRRADTYINPIGGIGLYSRERFSANGIRLQFLKTNDIQYNQLQHEFIPFLSIIDIMMFNTKEKIAEYLNSGYQLI
jgi:hypothetical protein